MDYQEAKALKIGDKVSVKASIRFETKKGTRSHHRTEYEKPRVGTVRSLGRRMEGFVVDEFEYNDAGGYLGSMVKHTEFTATKAFHVLLVAFGDDPRLPSEQVWIEDVDRIK